MELVARPTILQVASSVGKKLVAEWLVRFREAAVNAKDAESGYTALHRAVYHGQIHVARYYYRYYSLHSTRDLALLKTSGNRGFPL